MTVLDEARKYAPVLERMIDILAEDSMTFGAAMNQASRELGIKVPTHMEAPLLTLAFNVFAGRRIPGAAEA